MHVYWGRPGPRLQFYNIIPLPDACVHVGGHAVGMCQQDDYMTNIEALHPQVPVSSQMITDIDSLSPVFEASLPRN